MAKHLGIVWHTRTDEMSFAPLKTVLATKWTKRIALSCLMSFYSPDGLGLPMEMTGRFLFRQTWELGLDWDDELTPTFTKRWKNWEQQMGHIGHIKYPRSVGSEFKAIHIFADASGDGYGAAAYVHTDLGIHLVYARGKVVKSISQSIPMLETEACVVAYKMVEKLLRVYPSITLEQVHLWSDASCALSAIKAPSRDLARPIARRAALIRENTLVRNWHHVPTDLNPADILSRGCKAINLVNNKLWWHGPKFLQQGQWPPELIPCQEHIPMPEEQALARLVGIFSLLNCDQQTKLPTMFLTSSFRRGCRILYWVKLFILKLQKTKDLPERSESVGLLLWIRMDQAFHFPQVLHQLKTVGTTTDKEFQSLYISLLGGIVVVSGRLRKRGVPLLHKDSLLAKLWLEHIHANVLKHAGGSATLKAESAGLLWVWKGTSLFKRITSRCNHCIKLGTHSTPQHMAPLPDFRFNAYRNTAFETCGIDFAGPWWTHQGRAPGAQGDLPKKPRYLLVIACLTFRAIHLEMTYGHSTQDVLEALQRFASRRGIPNTIISDNAKELKKASEVLSQCTGTPIGSQFMAPGWGDVNWAFSHPRAPHTNGATEAMVGVAKRAIKKSMPKTMLTDSLLHTVFTYCEDIANRRPLIRNFTGDIHDPEVLTPAHFLGQAKGPLPPVQTQGPKNRFTIKWIEVAEIRDNFYRRFQAELTPELEKRAKWWDIRPAPEPGDVVCVLQTKLTEYGHWPLGKIIEVYSGRDGTIRSALVKLQDTILRRNLRHLIPLSDPVTHELANGAEGRLTDSTAEDQTTVQPEPDSLVEPHTD